MRPMETPARTSFGSFWRRPLAWVWLAPLLLLTEWLDRVISAG